MSQPHRPARGIRSTRLAIILASLMAALLALPASASAAVGRTVAPAPRAETGTALPLSTNDPSLAPTPYLGWNTWYGLGNDVSEESVLAEARAMKDRGLLAAGYDIVWIDGGWASPRRSSDGDLVPDEAKFPRGMSWLVDELHGLGMRAGIYTDAGPELPSVCGVASGEHRQQDADQFAEWGFDAVKIDFVCGWGAKADPKPAFEAMTKAVRDNASGRPMIVNLCNPVTSPYWGSYPPEQQSTYTWSYAPAIAESWRTYTDVGYNGVIAFRDVLRNYDANAAHPEVAGPGHWNDPDYLGPQLSMTDGEFRTQMSLWSIAAAPLVIGSRVSTLSEVSVSTLTNPEVLAINQDRLGEQGHRVGAAGPQEVWVKRLADGSRAVLLLNRADAASSITTTPADVGLDAQRVELRDVWAHRTSEAQGRITATVPAHGAVVYVAHKATGAPRPSQLSMSPPRITELDGSPVTIPAGEALVGRGETMTLEVEVTNTGTRPVRDLEVTARVPSGWSAPSSRSVRLLQPGSTVTVAFTVTVPADGRLGTATLALDAVAGGDGSQTGADLPVRVAVPVPDGAQDLAHAPWVSATSGWLNPTVDRSVGGWTPLKISGQTYATGIGVASPSQIRWLLGGSQTRLTGKVGIDDAAAWTTDGGTVAFSVIGDGRVLWESGRVTFGPARSFDVDVTGVRDLRLVVADAGDGGYNDRADWVDLSLR